MILYDDVTDILMINFQEPQEAITDPIGGRIHIRLDPITNEPVGLVITAFKQGFLAGHPDLAKAFETYERVTRTGKEEDFQEFIMRETAAAIEGGIIDENTGLPFELEGTGKEEDKEGE